MATFSINPITSFSINDGSVVLSGPMSRVDSAVQILREIEPKAHLTKLYSVQKVGENLLYKDPEGYTQEIPVMACEMNFGKGVLIFADLGHQFMPMALDYGDSDGISISPLIKDQEGLLSKKELEQITNFVFDTAKITVEQKEKLENQINNNTNLKTNKTMATENYLKSGQIDEEKVKEMLAPRISGDKEEFFKAHAADVQKIIKGYPTGVMEFANHKDNTLYKCRIHGVKEVTTDRASYLTFNMIYAREELKVSPKLTIGKGVCELNETQIENLNKWGRLNEPLEFKEPSGEVTRRYVAVDRGLNRLAFAHEKLFRVPEKIWETPLTTEQQIDLKAGKKVEFHGVKNGEEQKPLKCFYDPVMQTLRFEEIYQKKPAVAVEQAQGQTQQMGQMQGQDQGKKQDESIGVSSVAAAAVKSAGKGKGEQTPKKEQNQHM